VADGPPYAPPVRDIAFALEVVGADAAGDLDTMVEVVDGFGRWCAEVVAPLNQAGDLAGVGFDPATGRVTTTPGWKEAYAGYVEGGWNAVSFPAEHGGGGLPWVVTTAMQEELNAASIAFALCPMLTQGSVHLLLRYGTPAQQARWLEPLVTGAATGSMILTEPGAGSDVGALSTRAEPAGDGTYRLTGQKIFITYGEHDLTDDAVHVVLGRIAGAPAGTKGISCFLVPKFLPDGSRNAVRCIGVEHKMGLHASPTCTLQLDGAAAELVGEPEGGMAAMFTMMNAARLSVGVEGLGVAVRAQQAASAYALERVQGRVVGGAPGMPIAEHPDVRRMLLSMRAHIEGMRLLALRTSLAGDLGEQALADLLTPLTKAWCTDTGAEVARTATQVVGGMGYIRETGVEQLERDVRITAIYEGTNGIQAVDLVGRKLNQDDGKAVLSLLDDVDATAREVGGAAGERLLAASLAAREASAWLRTAWARKQRDALAGATPYLRLLATTTAGWLLGRQVLAARPRTADLFYAGKEVAGRWFLEQVVPHATGLVPAITSGAGDLDLLPAELLA
jgi:alkylation response protein AidB-like acyl-CoA dehydrogenase